MLERASRAAATVTEKFELIGQNRIAGVEVHEIKNIVFRNGVLTELFRDEWFEPSLVVRHIVHISMLPGTMSAWHCHKRQRDIIFPVQGQLRIGLYDDRRDSATYRATQVLNIGIMRPSYFFVPPGVWHAIKNATGESAAYVVINDEPYVYDDPDDWILATGDDTIPCKLD